MIDGVEIREVSINSRYRDEIYRVPLPLDALTPIGQSVFTSKFICAVANWRTSIAPVHSCLLALDVPWVCCQATGSASSLSQNKIPHNDCWFVRRWWCRFFGICLAVFESPSAVSSPTTVSLSELCKLLSRVHRQRHTCTK